MAHSVRAIVLAAQAALCALALAGTLAGAPAARADPLAAAPSPAAPADDKAAEQERLRGGSKTRYAPPTSSVGALRLKSSSCAPTGRGSTRR